MLNSKQRAALKSIASQTDAIFQIGKGGVGEAMVKSISDALEARELIKISVLENSAETARGAGEEIAKLTGSEVVAVIGRKIILYKVSSKPENRKISATL
ncbi:MAG: YhbY family RNA-binding protein [Clostridia bacterium]|jgi:RNA-binding protein|nr:YhbY family RNA-binding protein [Clostridia bacterium]MBR5312314.1 YhbY family RNA-binding protein [Clostridia bacterium]